MNRTQTIEAEHDVLVRASPGTVFDLIADVESWPVILPPAIHAERLSQGGDHDTVRRWMLAGSESVRSAVQRRHLDRRNGAISVEDVAPTAPRCTAAAEWRIRGEGAATRLSFVHRIVLAGDVDAAEFRAGLDARVPAQLDAIGDAAERSAELADLVLSFEDPLFIGGAAEDAFAVLNEADRWPERISHVSRLDMTEDEPGVQFFDMETTTPDGRAHSTRSVRICLPHELIVYKQIKLPALLDAHTGHWRFTTTPEGVVAGARHTVRIKPSAVEKVLGAGTTVQQARSYLRRVLSANSMKNLQLAKSVAEEPAHA